MKRFHETVDEAIKAKSLTLDQLAKRCGTHKGYVCGWRRGSTAPPSAKFVKRLAKVLDLDYQLLLIAAELEKIHDDVQGIVWQAVGFGLERITRPVEAVPSPKEPAAASAAAVG